MGGFGESRNVVPASVILDGSLLFRAAPPIRHPEWNAQPVIPKSYKKMSTGTWLAFAQP